MADSADQVEKHTLFLRLAVSIYKMKDDELKLLLETLDPDGGNTPGSSGGHPVRSQSVTDDPMQRQMMLARIFVLLKQSDTGTLLKRLRALKDPAFNWVRAYPRMACYLLVDFASQGRAYRSYIRDISASGVFIETAEKFQEGQVVSLCFTLSNANEPLPFKVKGHVSQIYPDGIGIQYDQTTYYQREILDTLIKKI
ncbi:PilZ domain-containing protein [Desulfatitalea tepidiphila]|uniref:PilZ domain-containing protein n=1 Tax=Desulfatitalea tepidiphila TaxID=1185843 RepID=UPI0006B67869|nr:PilZ domain-containing protein [Desulfatitalea tepidiphila]